MTEFRRLKMKVGEAEFEADVPENKVEPMYAQFLFMLERRNQPVVRPNKAGAESDKREGDTQATFRIGWADEPDFGCVRFPLLLGSNPIFLIAATHPSSRPRSSSSRSRTTAAR